MPGRNDTAGERPAFGSVSMTAPTSPLGSTGIVLGRVVAQTATPRATPVPTTPPDATGGLGLAAALVALAFVGAIAVTAAGTLIAGWAALRGSVLRIDVGPRQRRLLGVAAVCFLLSLFAVVGGVGPAPGAVFAAVFAVGVVALLVGTVWVLGSAARDRLGGRR